MVMPGRCYRQDTADATHLPAFHQIEGLVVDKGITLAHLAGTIDLFTKAYFGGGFASRLRPAYFPFTEPSAEFDIIRPDGSYLELGGCGMRPGLNHTAFTVESAAVLASISAEAKSFGWTVFPGDRHQIAGGAEVAYLEDRDGFEVELVAPSRTG